MANHRALFSTDLSTDFMNRFYQDVNTGPKQVKTVEIVVCVFSSHSFWTSSSLDVPAEVSGTVVLRCEKRCADINAGRKACSSRPDGGFGIICSSSLLIYEFSLLYSSKGQIVEVHQDTGR